MANRHFLTYLTMMIMNHSIKQKWQSSCQSIKEKLTKQWYYALHEFPLFQEIFPPFFVEYISKETVYKNRQSDYIIGIINWLAQYVGFHKFFKL